MFSWRKAPLLAGLSLSRYNDCMANELSSLLSRMRDSADFEMGPGEPLSMSPRQLEETKLDLEIITLARSGLTYVEIGRNLDIPLSTVVRRIAAMLNGEAIGSPEHLSAYLYHQLALLQEGIDSALEDMADNRRGFGIDEIDVDKVASANRHQGRMALQKFLVHQAAILGLMRQRIDVNHREQVEITVVNRADYEAL